MLYDPGWKPAIAPTEIPPIEPWRQILKDAADVIDKRGWTRGVLSSPFGVCAIGALRAVPNKRRQDLEKAKRKLMALLSKRGRAHYRLGRHITDEIMRWNDVCCHSKSEAIRTFRKAAET
jgi:hypothetical protein